MFIFALVITFVCKYKGFLLYYKIFRLFFIKNFTYGWEILKEKA